MNKRRKEKEDNNKEEEDSLNLLNISIIDSILEDDEDAFFKIISQIGDNFESKRFTLTNYKLPELLSFNPPFSSVCAFFGSEKCFNSLVTLFPEGINSQYFNESDAKGRLPIHFSFFGGNLNILRLFYQEEIDFNTRDRLGQMCSHYSAMSSSVDSIKYLWTKGVDVLTQVDYNRKTPLHTACFFGNVEIVKFLCEQVANDSNKVLQSQQYLSHYWKEETPLHLACQSGCIEIVNYILSKKELAKSQVNTLDFLSRTPLVCAIQSGSLECVKSLIINGNVKLNPKGKKHTPLIDAAACGYVDIVNFLIHQKNIELNEVNSKGVTALDAAILNDHLDVVKLLIDNGVSKDYDQDRINDLFLESCGVMNLEIVKYLDKKWSIPYSVIGNKLMKQAIILEWKDLVSFLVDKNCKIEKINSFLNFKSKWTPFMSSLKEKGADFQDEKDLWSVPLIIRSIKSGNLKSVKKMMDEGMKLNKDLISKYDCVNWACEKGKIDLFNFLLSYEPEINRKNYCILLLIRKINQIKMSKKPNGKAINDCIKMIRILIDKYDIDLNDNSIVSESIYCCSFELLEILTEKSVDFNVCTLNYTRMVRKEFLPIFKFLENHNFHFKKAAPNNSWIDYRSRFTNISAYYTPIQSNMSMSNVHYYDVNTLLFLIEYTDNDDLKNAKCYKGNVIDVLLSFKCFDGILNVYSKLNSVIYPENITKADFSNEIKNSSNQNLINFFNEKKKHR